MRKSPFIPTRGRSLVLGGLGALSLVVVAGAALAGSSGTYIPPLGITVPDEKAAAVQHSLPPGGTESSARAPIPTGPPDRIAAHMLAEDVPVPISPQVLTPSNAWLVSDGATLVAVYAGAAADDRSNGRFVIVRQNLAAGRQTEDVVDVPGAGALRLVDPPRGEGVETSAQHAQLGFHGSNGKAGVLDLATDHASAG
jgi:hypothetical protein